MSFTSYHRKIFICVNPWNGGLGGSHNFLISIASHATFSQFQVCLSMSATGFPVSASQIWILSLFEPESTHLQSGENATDMTQSVCPRNGSATGFPISASQIWILLSFEPESMCLPSGENATDMIKFVCPCKVSPTGFPISASQIQIVLSSNPETMCLPLGENATDQIKAVCPLNTNMEAWVSAMGWVLHKRRMVAFTYNP